MASSSSIRDQTVRKPLSLHESNSPEHALSQSRLILLTTYLTYVVVFTLTPFSFLLDPSALMSEQVLRRFEGPSSLAKLTSWDLTTNALFYLPLGYLVATHPVMAKLPPARRVFIVIVTSGVLSFSLELAQVFLPRHPSLADIACNTAGAALGGLSSVNPSHHMPIRTALKGVSGQRTLALTLTIYLILVVAAFVVPLPLSRDFTDWSSEFDVYLGSEWDGGPSWQGSIFQVSLYRRELTAREVFTNFLGGPAGDAACVQITQGLVFHYDFSAMPGNEGAAPGPFDLPVRLRVKDPARIQRLTPHGLAVRETSITLSTAPPIRPTGEPFFPHYEFSVEAWLAPADASQVSTARLVSYSTDLAQGTFKLAQDKREIAFELLTPGTLNGRNPVSWITEGRFDPSVRHVMVTYKDGVQIVYLNGRARERRLSQFMSALSDATCDFVGQHFKWPLYSVLMFILGLLTYFFHLSRRHFPHVGLISFVSALVPPVAIEGIRVLALKAPVDPFAVCVASGGVLSSILCGSSIYRIRQTAIALRS